ncbi:MAG: bifunctional phosphopantothenoylcysteine decarboxylase/phosphopantothenate--cysteine ligase CoaBC [Gallionella sp.]|nr:bifunctional phosphopantothenoylcysteine decarboxylase/phosphopantothenate--cysteine ligase CoaBC [Gallionella sp.]
MKQARPKRILLGITGGIAAYKSAELVRQLIRQGHEVQVAMTEASCHFITPTTLQALSKRPVLLSQWDDSEHGMAHIQRGREADLIVIAPATADFIAKLAHGLADDALSTLCLARNCPLLIAPAMNREMWSHPATQRNLAQLRNDGVQILGPAEGDQACGETGMGRMLEAVELAQEIHARLQPDILQGVRILLTAGPTYEAIDAVRGITNRSSGKMGYAIAQAARELGAGVTLVSGPVALTPPSGVNTINTTSANEMFEAVKQKVGQCDIFIGVAAVADYRVAQPSEHKLKKSDETLTLELLPNPDILAHVAALPNAPFCVGFAAESQHLAEYAEKKRLQKNLPLLVGNLAQSAIGSDENELILFDDAGQYPLPRADKLTLARELMRQIAHRFRERKT